MNFRAIVGIDHMAAGATAGTKITGVVVGA